MITYKILNNLAPNGEYFELVINENNSCYCKYYPLFGEIVDQDKKYITILWKHNNPPIKTSYIILNNNILVKSNLMLTNIKYNNQYVYKTNDTFSTIDTKVKVIAHYFPQYHVIPENEEWWGAEFTDWFNVKKGEPLFADHYQPHIPDDYLGYYNLTDINIQKKQIELAKQYGIYGFCFYAYWFNGKKLLEKPLDIFLENKELDLPFCICWANENWSRRWDGLENDILIEQKYSSEDDIKFIENISKYLKDSRYIKIDNKPLLMVYRPSIIPDVKQTTERWRNWCQNNGIGEIYLSYTQSFSDTDPKEYGFDAASQFPPNNGKLDKILNKAYKNKIQNTNLSESTIATTDWNNYLDQTYNYSKPDYTLFRCIMPSWDNTSRKKNGGNVITNVDPANFQTMAENAFLYTIENHKESERIVFVNAWNEWAEGCHLEPDKKYGYAWLQAIKNAHLLIGKKQSSNTFTKIKNDCITSINNTNQIQSENIGIIYHAFYPEYLHETIEYVKQCDLLKNCWFIITAPENKIRECKNIVSHTSSQFKYLFFESNNRGKDILPFFKIYDTLLSLNIKLFCKIHSKKSSHRQDGDIWRTELISTLLDPNTIDKIINNLCIDKKLGILTPKKYNLLLSNPTFTKSLLHKKIIVLSQNLEIYDIESQTFPAGSMFWSRIESLIPMYKIFDLSNETNYPEEAGQIDMTMAHVCERLFHISAQSIGLKTINIEDL